MNQENFIFVKGAREHNLKNVDVKIPRNKLVVITGLSGSGKSSLVFDTIYAEGQRRYIESLSSYARQFLGQMEKPDVDYIEGLSPAISIDQKAVSKNPRSTVGTVTEIYDYLRVLYARVGKAYCPIDGKPVQSYSVDEIVDFIESQFKESKIKIYAPFVRGRKGDYLTKLEEYFKKGFETARIDGKETKLKSAKRLDRYKLHNIDILIDELTVLRHSELPPATSERSDGGRGDSESSSDNSGSRVPSTSLGINKPGMTTSKESRSRLSEAVELSSKEAEGLVTISYGKDPSRQDRAEASEVNFSTKFSCPKGHIFEELEPRLFSFNSPYGACEECLGIGYKQEIDPTLVIPDYSKTIDEGAILPWSYTPFNYYGSIVRSIARELNIKTNVPLKNLSKDFIETILWGSGEEYLPVTYYSKGRPFHFTLRFKGMVDFLESRYQKTDSEAVKEEITKYMSKMPCDVCSGKRLKKQSLSVKVAGLSIDEVVAMPTIKCLKFFEKIDLNKDETQIAERLIKEIKSRLKFLNDVGLGYLTLNRYANSLSGGETQRIRLASQIGSGLVGVLYVLDEPSIGLHQKDNHRLLETLKNLRDLGNTVLVIEHDEETMREADHIVDVGPGAGALGGEIVAEGSIGDILKNNSSLTASYLRGDRKIEIPSKRRKLTGNYISIVKASANNLKNLTVRFPLNDFIVVTGVSGSGKSTLVNEVLYKGMCREIGRGWEKPGNFERIEGKEFIDKIIDIDQSPIGRTPRSNPATYTKSFDLIRELFASTKESRVKGYLPGRFSFNVTGGRCEKCHGDGSLKIEMHFLPDVYIPCDVCKGARYNRETLEIKFKGKSIADILDMTIDEAGNFFENIPNLSDKLSVLQDVGLGYVKLGQNATTLSGGEAQRIKLSSELSKRATGKTLYILDEPTTGLHFEDVKKLLLVLNRLVDAGNTVVVIEHNLDVIKTADYIIDLGPEGGNEGGKVVAAGTPEMLSGIKSSYTGQFLKKVLYSCVSHKPL